MNINPEQIDQWRVAPSEYQCLEFKTAGKQFDNKMLCEYCVALANEGGGHLLLGVEDKPPRPVVGTQAFGNLIEMEEMLFEALGFRVGIEEVVHSDGRVLVFQIPERPQGTAYHLDGRYLVRSGESIVPMSQDQLRNIFDEDKPHWLEEPCNEGLSAQDVVELLDTQTFFELLGLHYPSNREAVIEHLERESLIDRTAKGHSIRRIGALLLAKRVEDFPFEIGAKAPRVVVYSGNSKMSTKLDRVQGDGYAVGFERLVQFIMEQIPQREVIKDALRKKIQLVPETPIRELVANALIHQDFTLTGMRVMIDIYATRVEISNPGNTLVPLDRSIDTPRSRNRRLASIMRGFSISEEQGSGIDKIFDAMEEAGLPAPEFRVSSQRTNIVLHGRDIFDDVVDNNVGMRAL